MSDGEAARNCSVNRHIVALCIRKLLQFGRELSVSPRSQAREVKDAAGAGSAEGRVRTISSYSLPRPTAEGQDRSLPRQARWRA